MPPSTTFTPLPASITSVVPHVNLTDIGEFVVEDGTALPVVVAWESFGELNADASNAILVEHALTGSSHATQGLTDIPGWWDALIGPGRPLNTDQYCVICTNMLGGCYGTTGPASLAPDGRPWGSRFPLVTIRDSVRAEKRLSEELGIDQFCLVIGGSMGGARALEWAVTYPDSVRNCAIVAIGAQSSAEQIAWALPQSLAIRNDPNFRGGDYYDGERPCAGLGLARRIAHTTYRSERELSVRFGRAAQPGEDPFTKRDGARGRYAVESYLDHKADSLAERFDANSYLVLTDALMSHDVARGRGDLAAALAPVTANMLVASVSSDRLYLPEQSEELAAALPGDVTAHVIESDIGHDGFLTELDQLGGLLSTLDW